MTDILNSIFNYHKIEQDYPLHNFHAYPCKFPAFIPREIIKKFAVKGDIICDPFAGSGTTLLESTLLGYSSVGNDINPISCLLTEVKANPISKRILFLIDNFLLHLLPFYQQTKQINCFSYPKIEHWFQTNVIRELSFLKQEIIKVENIYVKKILFAILSSIIVRVSNQESDTRYAAIDKQIPNLKTIQIFIKKTQEIKNIYLDFYEKTRQYNFIVAVHQSDGRYLNNIENNSVDIIITSPPYANTYDYYLYHKHRQIWLDMDIQFAQDNEIGSRREFSSIKENPKKWKEDMMKCLGAMKRIIKQNKYLFMVIGDSVINKKLIQMDQMIKELAIMHNLRCVKIVSSLLSKHSKMFNPKFSAQCLKKEHLIQLQKI